MVSPTTSSSASSSTSSNTGTDQQMIASNFDQFLTLLTTQLKNQNPLDPMDTNQFTAQLVQFASVEQQMKQNTALSTLVTNTNNANMLGALNFVGKTVTASGTQSALANGSATWVLNAPGPGTATITIQNAQGQTVSNQTQALTGGKQTFTWNGQGPNGTTLPDGAYSINVKANSVDGTALTVSTEISGTVDGVDLSGSSPALKIGPLTIDMSTVTSIEGS